MMQVDCLTYFDISKARKLAEMMDNANWREEQRANKVKAYRKKEEEDSNL